VNTENTQDAIARLGPCPTPAVRVRQMVNCQAYKLCLVCMAVFTAVAFISDRSGIDAVSAASYVVMGVAFVTSTWLAVNAGPLCKTSARAWLALFGGFFGFVFFWFFTQLSGAGFASSPDRGVPPHMIGPAAVLLVLFFAALWFLHLLFAGFFSLLGRGLDRLRGGAIK